MYTESFDAISPGASPPSDPSPPSIGTDGAAELTLPAAGCDGGTGGGGGNNDAIGSTSYGPKKKEGGLLYLIVPIHGDQDIQFPKVGYAAAPINFSNRYGTPLF